MFKAGAQLRMRWKLCDRVKRSNRGERISLFAQNVLHGRKDCNTS
ncbi:unnamed protein product [Haemonchus placei]|uniref:Uncharacterized protein n=1 Tax=Haemonchus placei TaxID=6290 RepID=A0A0N4W0N3_HAEPC|nr:unnamed protein product [Haemonchus placei]